MGSSEAKVKRSLLPAETGAMALLVLIDQVTKMAAEGALKGKESIVLIRGVLEFYYLENHGAAFGVLQNARGFFLLVTFLAMGAVFYVLFRMPLTRKYLPLRILVVLIGAGAVGNVIDRIVFSYVRDFIYFSLIDFPVFNVADIYVTCATILLALTILFYYKGEHDFDFLSGKKGGSNDSK
jgi:signal peptidase II